MKSQLDNNLIIDEDATILEAIKKINENSQQLICIIDHDGKLLGMASDGDIRRALANGSDLDSKLRDCMNINPMTMHIGSNPQDIQSLMLKHKVGQVPLVDDKSILINIVTQQSIVEDARHENWVILMAGGKGTRLRPLTNDLPKPLIPIAGRPIIETIIKSFSVAGYKQFYVSVNYLRDKIKDHLQDGSQWATAVHYLDENEPTGTAGSLALLPERPTAPFFIMNSDILTNVDFSAIRKKHEKQKNVLTVCARTVETTIAYGVLDTDGDRITGCREKPTERRQVNAGVYMANPEILDIIGPDVRFFNMTDVIDECLKKGLRIGIFHIHEYWSDIGQISDLKAAKEQYAENFSF